MKSSVGSATIHYSTLLGIFFSLIGIMKKAKSSGSWIGDLDGEHLYMIWKAAFVSVTICAHQI